MPLTNPPALESKVRHPRFGIGVVKGVKGITGYGSLVVKFPHPYGIKEVLWIFAKEKMEAVQ